MKMILRMLSTLLCSSLLVTTADADETTMFTVPVVADYEFQLLGGTPINPGQTTDFIPFQAIGELTFVLSPLLNDPSEPATVEFTDVTGVLTGTEPGFALPHTISPNLEFLGGDLTNIVRDSMGEVISADVSGLSMRWILEGTPGNVTMYTQEGLPFDAIDVAIPFEPGTVLSGAADFNVFLDDGDPMTDDLLVVIGRNRTLTVTAIPEPGLTLFGLTASAFLCVRRKRIN